MAARFELDENLPRAAHALLAGAEHERLNATLDVLSAPDLMKQIAASRRFYAARKRGLTFEVFAEPLRPVAKNRRG